ncbi:MAG TPA: hypothetical protein VGF28_02790 [Thermoanaerobaculia bacterium]|jgi:hypothetical protein
MIRRSLTLALFVAATLSAGPLEAQCYINYGLADNAKPNKLFLYFPTASDSTFPDLVDDFGNPVGATPALPFNASDLDSSLGTTAQFRNAVFDIVKSDYCEFNVQVTQTTTNPDSAPTPAARRVVVAIGSDSHSSLYGIASAVDTGDADVTDHARVWADSYGDVATGGELSGSNATLQRWANGIGGTASHEGGHTYGLAHSNDITPRPGEDADTRHIMRAGVTVGTRVGGRRHFSDTGFGLLAANVGLAVQTVHNWDFTNPNSVDARELRMEILSTQASLTLGWAYNGLRSPWLNPVISTLAGTVTFKGTTYNRFQVRWSSGQAWSNTEAAPFEPSGTVGPAKNFHIGATFVGVDFNTPDPVIVRNVTLHDASGTALPLHPRMVAYDAGALDAFDGSFDVRFFNMGDPTRPLLIRDVRVFELPRVLSIDSMLAGKPMFTWENLPVVPWRSKELPNATVRDEQVLTVATLKQGHTIFIDHDRQRPNNYRATGAADVHTGPEVNDVARGIATGLFPSTIVYITLTVVDPDAEHWDPVQARMVRGPVESKLFYQLRGVRPDLNRNGQDDLVEIYQGAPDSNGNGVIDTVEGSPTPAPGGPAKVRFSPFVGWTRFDDSVPLEDGPVAGIRASSLGTALALEGELGFTVTEDATGNEGTMVQLGVNARRLFGAPTATLRPFLLAGAGGLLFRGFSSDDEAMALHLGGGLERRLGSTTIRLDLRDIVAREIYSSGTTHNWQFTVGLGF